MAEGGGRAVAADEYLMLRHAAAAPALGAFGGARAAARADGALPMDPRDTEPAAAIRVRAAGAAEGDIALAAPEQNGPEEEHEGREALEEDEIHSESLDRIDAACNGDLSLPPRSEMTRIG